MLFRPAESSKRIVDFYRNYLLTTFRTNKDYYNAQLAHELAEDGVKAITTSCGFLAAFQKELADCQLADQTVTVRLEQEDTLKISNNVDVQIQMKVKTTGGDVLVSKIVKRSAAIVLDREAI